jgi:hypothetical protein
MMLRARSTPAEVLDVETRTQVLDELEAVVTVGAGRVSLKFEDGAREVAACPQVIPRAAQRRGLSSSYPRIITSIKINKNL